MPFIHHNLSMPLRNVAILTECFDLDSTFAGTNKDARLDKSTDLGGRVNKDQIGWFNPLIISVRNFNLNWKKVLPLKNFSVCNNPFSVFEKNWLFQSSHDLQRLLNNTRSGAYCCKVITITNCCNICREMFQVYNPITYFSELHMHGWFMSSRTCHNQASTPTTIETVPTMQSGCWLDHSRPNTKPDAAKVAWCM